MMETTLVMTNAEPGKLLENVMMRNHYAGEALIEILHAAQELHGYLSPPLLNEIARKLRLPPSRVLGVATFYHLFHFAPPAKHTACVCLGTACYVSGAAGLANIVRESGWTLEVDRCAGACGLAPLVVCDGIALTRTTPAQLQNHLQGKNESRNTLSGSAG
jgi:bidirectional [NiFe] hydrogenase diaphorase subunit